MQDTVEDEENPSDRCLEQETIVRFDETGSAATLYTASKRVASKLIKAGHTPTKVIKVKGRNEIAGWWFSVPTAAVLIKRSGKSVRLGVQHRDGMQERSPATAAQLKNLSQARTKHKVLPQVSALSPALF